MPSGAAPWGGVAAGFTIQLWLGIVVKTIVGHTDGRPLRHWTAGHLPARSWEQN